MGLSKGDGKLLFVKRCIPMPKWKAFQICEDKHYKMIHPGLEKKSMV